MKTKLMYDIEDIRITMRINDMTFTEKAIVERVLQCTLPKKAITIKNLKEILEDKSDEE